MHLVGARDTYGFPLSLLSSSFIFSPPRATDSKPSAVSPHCALTEGRLKFERLEGACVG